VYKRVSIDAESWLPVVPGDMVVGNITLQWPPDGARWMDPVSGLLNPSLQIINITEGVPLLVVAISKLTESAGLRTKNITWLNINANVVHEGRLWWIAYRSTPRLESSTTEE
jgi:hypothetical protein